MTPEILTGLDDERRRFVLARMPRRSFRKGETVFFEGDVGDSLHVVESGKLAVRVSTPLGDVVTLRVLGEGASFGEQALLSDDSLRSASVVALERVETRVLHRRDFEQLCRDEPSVERLLALAMAAQVRRLSTLVVEAMYLPAEQRVVRRLAYLADIYDEGRMPIDIPLRQEDLATMAGTTRQTTNQVLKQLEEAGVVMLRRGGVEVHQPEELTRRGR